MTDHGKGIHRVNRGMRLHGPVLRRGIREKGDSREKTQVVAYDHKPAKDGFRDTWRKEREGIGHKTMRETVRYKG